MAVRSPYKQKVLGAVLKFWTNRDRFNYKEYDEANYGSIYHNSFIRKKKVYKV